MEPLASLGSRVSIFPVNRSWHPHASAKDNMITIGVISDTHGLLDRKVAKLFVGVDHILHAGDIGTGSVLRQLEEVAPVSASSGPKLPAIPE